MALVLTEAVVDAVKAKLETNMAAKLDALNAEYGDGLTLIDIRDYYISEQALMEVPEFPVLFILADRMNVLNEGAGMLRGQYTLTVGVLATDDHNTANLKRRLYRYIRAIIEVLIEARTEARTSGGWAYTVGFEVVEFSPVFSRDNAFLADAQVSIVLSGIDTY